MTQATFKHGAWAYNNHGCRCEVCTAAHNEYHRTYNWRTGRRMPMAAWRAELAQREGSPHGTESRYVNRGCRCDECKAASRQARARRRARVAA